MKQKRKTRKVKERKKKKTELSKCSEVKESKRLIVNFQWPEGGGRDLGLIHKSLVFD